MPRYQAFGLSIDSEIELHEPSVVFAGDADVVIRHGEIEESPRRSTPDEEFVNVASKVEFRIRRGREVVVKLRAGVEPDALSLLLSGRILAYIWRQRGWLPLHASAVAIGREAVLFVAPVGTGKSTTAAAFYARGYSVLSDDIAPVRSLAGKSFVRCGVPTLRLCQDAALAFRPLAPDASFIYDKYRLRLVRDYLPVEMPIARIYLLQAGEDLRLECVPSLTAVAALGRECFVKLRNAGPEVLRDHLAACAAVVEATPIRSLARPRDLSKLDDLVTLVESDLSGRGG